MIENIEPVSYAIGSEHILVRDINTIRINPGDSLFNIESVDMDRRLAKETKRKETISRELRRYEKYNNSYAQGYCTWYVASKVQVPSNWGNAINWPVNSETPKVGGIVKTNEDGRGRGHVAYIESVSGDDIKISEMNVRGWNIKSTRTISIHNSHILGYIN